MVKVVTNDYKMIKFAEADEGEVLADGALKILSTPKMKLVAAFSAGAWCYFAVGDYSDATA